MGREALAEAMIPVIGRLYRENNVVTSIHGRSLINKSTMNILKAHRFARRMSKDELLLEETAPLLNTLANLELGAAAIDIASSQNQKIYDCLYLALALERGEPLATADRRMAQIAQSLSIETELVQPAL